MREEESWGTTKGREELRESEREHGYDFFDDHKTWDEDKMKKILKR